MKIVVTSTGPEMSSPMDERFGRAMYFMLIDLDTDSVTAISNEENAAGASGAGVQAAQAVSEAGAETLLTGHIGPKAQEALQAAGIKVFLTDSCSVQDAVGRFREGKLEEA